MIGCIIDGGDVSRAIEEIRTAETRGVPAAWMTTAGAGHDALTIFAAAAVSTERIVLGASIIPTWPRHPIAVVQQSQVIEKLAPGRLVLGLGPSNKPSMERLVGAAWRSPRQHLREYVTITRTLLHDGKVDFEGSQYTARAQIATPLNVPVMIGALRSGTYELAGKVADGAISWLTPWEHVKNSCLPVMVKAAEAASRQAPRLVAHVPFCLSEDAGAVQKAVREEFGFYTRLPTYAAMFEEAGFPGEWSDGLTDAVVAYGSDEEVIERFLKVLAGGAADVIADLVLLEGQSREQAFELVAEANRRVNART